MADIRNTNAGKVVDEFFDKFAQGSKGDATVEELDFDAPNIRFKVKIRHRHVARIFRRKVTVYDLSTFAQGSFDLAKGGEIEVCTDSPVGKICIDAVDLIQILAGILI